MGDTLVFLLIEVYFLSLNKVPVKWLFNDQELVESDRVKFGRDGGFCTAKVRNILQLSVNINLFFDCRLWTVAMMTLVLMRLKSRMTINQNHWPDWWTKNSPSLSRNTWSSHYCFFASFVFKDFLLLRVVTTHILQWKFDSLLLSVVFNFGLRPKP